MRARLLLLLIVSTLAVTPSFAGLKWADIGVNGLTCSLCTRSVEMSLLRLHFVDRVVMSLETTEGRIFFKQGIPVDLNQIAKAVVNAGFSIRFVRLEMSFEDIPVGNDGSFTFQGQTFKWIDFRKPATGSLALKLIDERFLPKKETAEWKKKISEPASRGQEVLYVVQQD